MKKLLIYGCGYPSITSLIEYLNTRRKEWEIVGFLDDNKFGKIDEYMGYPIVGNKDYIPKYVAEGCYFFNNVASTPKDIETVANKLSRHQAKICTLVFPEPPDMYPDTIKVGEGSIISPQVVVGVETSIGKHVVVRQRATIGHESQVGDYCFIGPDACVLGRVTIGSRTLIGAKALLRENITVGKNCIIGMGAVVTKNVSDNTTVVGNPARPLARKESKLSA
ncbi:MAG: NeuD/PglB/VioB family sugar acetyltransferase [Balneolaceae bacterium]|jgi:acetyltransferase EpsM